MRLKWENTRWVPPETSGPGLKAGKCSLARKVGDERGRKCEKAPGRVTGLVGKSTDFARDGSGFRCWLPFCNGVTLRKDWVVAPRLRWRVVRRCRGLHGAPSMRGPDSHPKNLWMGPCLEKGPLQMSLSQGSQGGIILDYLGGLWVQWQESFWETHRETLRVKKIRPWEDGGRDGSDAATSLGMSRATRSWRRRAGRSSS